MSDSNLKVKSMTVYVPTEALPGLDQSTAPKETAEVTPRYSDEKMPGPDLIVHEIETRDYRKHLGPNEVQICINMQPGEEELGQFHVNFQLEGAVPRLNASADEEERVYNSCIQKQNEFLELTSEWLCEILGDFAAEWDVNILAQPCPKATDKLNLGSVARTLECRPAVMSENKRENIQETPQRVDVLAVKKIET